MSASMSAPALLLSIAILAGPGHALVQARASVAPARPRRPHRRALGPDPLAIATSLDVLAVCLSAGMAVSHAATATAASAPAQLARVLRRAADLLSLGADPATAWSAPPDLPADTLQPQVEALLRLARRSASSGAALGESVIELAAQCRHDAVHTALAATERAGVLIAGPLGLCFLPAFVCLGVIPVVAGLASTVARSGLL